jgi:hypothetical protein
LDILISVLSTVLNYSQGPTQHLSCKRMYIEDNLSDYNGVKTEESEERRAHLPPKRLCKTEDTDRRTYKSRSIQSLCQNAVVWKVAS